ncbi:hypothetical protein BDB00DRAFT_90919 [Zychaea mexicana]|uniref:uncharacterized protein n=1 Tax=Zychaea mexicana TaxID=64656 RepID=UPI0022FEC179|nr:uncharacterized protein BDB00DRAFT_90919 [Zychaea mexicana]KAI9485055.1 hypothetical protein BDB00DRAFT_90919 [Zychaea mexicana]
MDFVSISAASRRAPTATATAAHSTASSYHSSSAQRQHNASISFVRCLYQAKAIVQDLEHLRSSALFKGPSVTPQMIVSIQTYLDTTFNKLVRLCKTLQAILNRMYAQSLINRERYQSFKADIVSEWRRATHIRLTMTNLLHRARRQQANLLPPLSTTTTTSSSRSPSLLITQDDRGYDEDNDIYHPSFSVIHTHTHSLSFDF